MQKIITTPQYTVEFYENVMYAKISAPSGKFMNVFLPVLFFRHECNPKQIDYNGTQLWCSRLCCYHGCYMEQSDKKRVEDILQAVKPLLTQDAQSELIKSHDIFYCEKEICSGVEVWKTKSVPEEWKEDELQHDSMNFELPKNYCIFLMDNGLCALHKHYNDVVKNWITEKIHICVTFPLDIQADKNYLAHMENYDDFMYFTYDCINFDEELKKKLGMRPIVESMSNVIIEYCGQDWYNAFIAFSKDYLAGKYVDRCRQ